MSNNDNKEVYNRFHPRILILYLYNKYIIYKLRDSEHIKCGVMVGNLHIFPLHYELNDKSSFRLTQLKEEESKVDAAIL